MYLSMSIPDFLLSMASGLLVIGTICLVTGIFLLVIKVAGTDIRALVTTTTKLAQKGLTEDVSGLVGNASTLLNALNQLVRTTAGVGVFLIFTSFVLLLASYVLIMQIN